MAVKKTTNSKNSRPGDDITTSVPAKVDFTENTNTKAPKDDSFAMMAMWSMVENNVRNTFSADNLPDSLGYYIDEAFEVDDHASTRINGETITSSNFYSSKGSYGGDFSSFTGVFRNDKYDVTGFIPKLGKLSNIHADGTFDQAFAIVVASEGGFSNHKSDRGGATIFGVASKSNPSEYKQIMSLLENGENQAAMEFTKQVYKKKYWDVAGIDRLQDPEARLVAFDAAINHGAGYARKMINRVGEDADGMLKYRANTYIQIVNNDPEQQTFMKGWRNRLAKLDSIIANDAAPLVKQEIASTPVKAGSTLAAAFEKKDAIKVPVETTPTTFLADAGNAMKKLTSKLPSLDLNPFN